MRTPPSSFDHIVPGAVLTHTLCGIHKQVTVLSEPYFDDDYYGASGWWVVIRGPQGRQEAPCYNLRPLKRYHHVVAYVGGRSAGLAIAAHSQDEAEKALVRAINNLEIEG